MKIVHAGLMVNLRGEGLCRALKEVSTEYCETPIGENTKSFLQCVPFVPDIVFLQIQGNKVGSHNVNTLAPVLSEFMERGTKVINWNGDIRAGFPVWMIELPSTIIAFSNMRDVERAAPRGRFLQIGIDPVTFKRWGPQENDDVVFMGNDYKNQFELGEFRRSACRILRSEFNAKLYGNYPESAGSLNANPNDPFPMQSQESKIYSACGIAISISHVRAKRYTSDRLLRCMGSGAFTLAHHYEGIEMDFEVGKHLDTFTDLDEMREKIKYYLSNPDIRKQIASQGYEHVQNNFTYYNMAQNIINL